jgi:RNA polymerase-binding transcription factor DksA
MKDEHKSYYKTLELERLQTTMSLNRLAPTSTNDPVEKQHRQRLQAKLDRIDNALLRLASGEYGTCQSCKKAINPERLEALPYTELCIACQRGLERRTFPRFQAYQYSYR